MAATLRDSAAIAAASGFTDPELPVPTNDVGDVVVLVYVDSATMATLGWPSGFTELFVTSPQGSPFSYANQIAVAWKVVSGSADTGDYVVTNSNVAHASLAAFAYQGAEASQFGGGAGVDYNSVAYNGSASPTTLTVSGISAPAAGDAILWAAGWAVNAAIGGLTLTDPTISQGAMSQLERVQRGTLNILQAAGLDNVSSGATGNAASTLTGYGCAACGVILRITATSGGGGSNPGRMLLLGVG